MYRILDLISEQGSGGLGEWLILLAVASFDVEKPVDKIIIAQDSLERFINKVAPGAYSSLTKVDFNALDKVGVKPFGVYGSKAQIVDLLYSVGAVDNKM